MFDSSRAGYHMVMGFRLYPRCRLVAVWWMSNMRSFCFIVAFRNFATLENRLTYPCPSSRPIVITMKKKVAGTWKKKNIGYWPVQINGNKFASDQIRRKTGRSCEGADFSWLSSKVSRTLPWLPHNCNCWYPSGPCCKVKCIERPNMFKYGGVSYSLSLILSWAMGHHHFDKLPLRSSDHWNCGHKLRVGDGEGCAKGSCHLPQSHNTIYQMGLDSYE